jgi:hypothetical protein
MDFNTVHLLFLCPFRRLVLGELFFSAILPVVAEKNPCRCGKVVLSAKKCLKNLRIYGNIA